MQETWWVRHEHLYINELHCLLRTEKGWKPEGAVDWTLTWGVRPWQMYRMGMLSESGPWSTHRSGLRLFLSYRHTRTHAHTHTCTHTHTHTHTDAIYEQADQTHFALQIRRGEDGLRMQKLSIFLSLLMADVCENALELSFPLSSQWSC